MIFLQKQYKYFSDNLSPVGTWKSHLYNNQEIIVTVEEDVTFKPCFVIGSLTGPSKEVLEMLQLLHCLRVAGASEVNVISPYWGYQRHDKNHNNTVTGVLWSDGLLKAAMIDNFTVVEAHLSEKNIQKCLVKPKNISAFFLFIPKMNVLIKEGYSFVFPDKSARDRSVELLKAFPQVKIGTFFKNRKIDTIIMEKFEGDIASRVILFDDILDTGQTLLQACIALKQLQVKEIVIFVTHAFFSSSLYEELFLLGVTTIFCTDSVPQARHINNSRVQVYSLAFVLSKECRS